MKTVSAIIVIISMIGAVFSETAGSAVADKLVFPVLSDNHNATQNNEDPRNYGWFVDNGFGHDYPGNPVCADCPYHPAEDWNRTDGRDNSGNEPVYSIGDGMVARIEKNNGIYGGTILIRYELNREIDFSPYFLPGTTAKELYRRGRYIIAQYMHVAVDGNLQKDQSISLGQRLGTIMSVYSGKTLQHLHFEMMVDPNGNQSASTARNDIGYYRNQQGITDDGYLDPTKFILGYLVGLYPNGFHADGSSQAFIDAFNRNYNKIGWPADHGGGAYVHSWASQRYPSYSVWLQDFQGDMNADHFGTDGQSAIILSDYIQTPRAFLIKEGMWGYYKTHNGQYELGAPFTEEITANYADSPFNLPADPIKAGDTITVQKFYRVYGDQRKTLVYNNTRGGSVVNFPVGEFSLGTDFGQKGEQVYVYVDGPLANDILWPNGTQKVPTGKWFTKPGDYIFVRHVNGQRVGTLSVHISEGNHQFVGGSTVPENLTATAETASSIRLAFSLPSGLPGYNIRVYQDGTKIADMPARENCLVSGLSHNTYYCFRVSAVDNASGLESDRSLEACITTLPGYTVNRTTTCKSVNSNSPNDPIDETTTFYNSNNLVCSWIKLGNVYGAHVIKWRWYDPDGNLIREDSINTSDPASQGYPYWSWSMSWAWLGITSINSYGTWQVRIYVDDNLVANDSFSLVPSAGYTVNWTAICKGANPDSPYDPANRATVFYNSNNFVYAWLELGNVYGNHYIAWEWSDPNGNLIGVDTAETTSLHGEEYREHGLFDISAKTNYGTWQVKTYVDNSLVANASFSLVASNTGSSYRLLGMIISKDIVPNQGIPLGNPINETTVFYNSNKFVYSCILLTEVRGVSKIKWRWFDSSGSLAIESLQYLHFPVQGFCWSWGWLDIATNTNYGTWQVATYVDDNLVTNRTFTLAPPAPVTVTLQIVRDEPSSLLVTVSGPTSSFYTVQSATNIMGSWTDYTTVYFTTNGVSSFTVPNTPPARFFK